MTAKSSVGCACASVSNAGLIFVSAPWVFAPAGVVCIAVTMTATRQNPAQRVPTHPRLLTRLPRRGFPPRFTPSGDSKRVCELNFNSRDTD